MFNVTMVQITFNDLVTEKMSLSSCSSCYFYRFPYGQFYKFGDENNRVKQKQVSGVRISRWKDWPAGHQQKQCHLAKITPHTHGHIRNQPFYGKLFHDKNTLINGFNFDLPSVKYLDFESEKKCTQNVTFLYKCAELKKKRKYKFVSLQKEMWN